MLYIFAATITHGVDNTKLESIKMTDNAVSVTYEDLSEEMEKEAEEGEEEEKEVVYKCNFAVVIAYEGTRGNIHREFIVKFNPAGEFSLIPSCQFNFFFDRQTR